MIHVAKKGYSIPSPLGGYDHFDENGKKVGYSLPGILGGYDHYDRSGKKTGYSVEDVFGGYVHYDRQGKKTGYSVKGVLDGYDHYDRENRKTGYSNKAVLGGYDHYSSTTSGSCYIATCVYGSYESDQVRFLRNWRDRTLSKTAAGRTLIRLYYRISPWFVRHYAHRIFFRRLTKHVLDRLISLLKQHGHNRIEHPEKP